MSEIRAVFKLEQNEPINAKFALNVPPSKVSELENDLGFITADDIPEIDTSELATKEELENVSSSIPTKTSQLTNDNGFLTEHQDISSLATKEELNQKQDEITDLDTIRTNASKGATAVQPEQLATESLYGLVKPDNDTITINDGVISTSLTDVQVNGTSVLSEGVANIPIASNSRLGVVFPAGFGVMVTASGALAINKASDALIDAKANNFQPVVPSNLDYAVKVGVTTNTKELTDEEKTNACAWLGAEEKIKTQTLNATDNITLTDGYTYIGGEQTALTMTLPETIDVSFICNIEFTSGATATTLEYPNTIKWLGDDVAENVFTPVANKHYSVICYYNGVDYVCVVKGVA